MSTSVPGFQSFSGFVHHFVLASLATSSIRVNSYLSEYDMKFCEGVILLARYSVMLMSLQ